jgi:superfamily II DNA or RNA helicase
MEPSRAVPPLSSGQNFFRRLSRGYKARAGQQAFWKIVSENLKQTYLGVLPTGYGKSDTALGAYFIARDQGRVNRMLIVVPTDTQRSQYVADLTDSARRMGFDLVEFADERSGALGVARLVSHQPADLRLSFENRCEVFVTTVQSVLSDGAFYRELLAKGRWLTFFDEYHKLNQQETARWGRAAAGVRGDVVVGLTATPIRSDNSPTIFDGIPVDVTVSFQTAYREQAIRGVIAHVEHYFVDVRDKDGNEERITTETLRGIRDWETYQKKRDLRFVDDYLCGMLSLAHDCLQAKNIRHPRQHQMLVFAMGLDHAKHVSDLLNAVYGAGFSDWVGMTRNDSENEEVFRRYQDNRLDCLVQVDKATEGFNSKRASVLVFLNLLRKDTVKAIQGAGRGVRRNPDITTFSEDVCDMFASADSGAAELIQDFARLTVGIKEQPKGGSEEGGDGQKRDPSWIPIPPLESSVLAAEHDRSELIQITREEIKVARSAVMADVTSRNGAGFVRQNVEAIEATLSDEKIEMILRRIREKEQVATVAQFRSAKTEVTRASVAKAVRMLAGNIARRHYASADESFKQSLIGNLSGRIHTQWMRQGGRPHGEALHDDLHKKHEWLMALSEEIKVDGGLPGWLDI